MRRYARRRDRNEPELVTLAKRLGAEMEQVGPLDWWVGWRGKWIPAEVKRPDKEGWASEFTDTETAFIERCRLAHLPFWIWRTEQDVLDCLNARAA
jgi:hypothetical protein